MHDEVSTYRDIVFLPINESRFNCALKPLLWYEHCARAFPTAQYYAIADDDTYLQLEHFVADIRTLRAAPDANVLWGLVMWYGAYDSATMVPHEAWGGWSYTDAGAVKLRRRIEKCRLAAQSPSDAANAVVAAAMPSAHRRHDPCSRISAANRATVPRESLGEDAPWPVINGPLFAVSSHLARLLVSDPLPRTYLRELHATPRVRAALTRKGGPRKSNFGCWPVGDTIFGLWISRITTARNLSVQLVNSPFMVQHHPWPAAIHGAFSNPPLCCMDERDNRRSSAPLPSTRPGSIRPVSAQMRVAQSSAEHMAREFDRPLDVACDDAVEIAWAWGSTATNSTIAASNDRR